MKRIPVYCPENILGVRAGDILAGCDWKQLVFLGDAKFAVYEKTRARTIHGFTKARNYYNALPYPNVHR